jgi:hypothetical protein
MIRKVANGPMPLSAIFVTGEKSVRGIDIYACVAIGVWIVSLEECRCCLNASAEIVRQEEHKVCLDVSLLLIVLISA